MNPACPHCVLPLNVRPERPTIVRFGFFRRRSDSRKIQRFRCLNCQKSFSTATFHPCFQQKKRHKNHKVRGLLCSGVSQRRIAQILCLHRITIARKLVFLAQQAALQLEIDQSTASKVEIIEFDEQETFEHTKCKPLSVLTAVQYKTRKILAIEVSQMPCRGRLAKTSLRKYGYRADHRTRGRRALFERLQKQVVPWVHIKSDLNPHYVADIRKFFPEARHSQFKGAPSAETGQGELKKLKFDPLFSINHTLAKFRADISRLIRKTWCTTKKAEKLSLHLLIYAQFHNERLKKQVKKAS